MLAPVMTMGEGARIYSPAGELLRPGDRLEQPGLVRTLELLAEEGARSVYSGTIAESLLALCAERGGLVTREDLETYEARWREPLAVGYAGTRFLTRGGLSGIAPALSGVPPLRGFEEPERTLALFDALYDTGHVTTQHTQERTTNLTCVDAEGNACVVTTSLGLCSGDWLPGLDLHLNS